MSIKWEMKYEMENKLAIVMSNKGSYPEYIKWHTIQKPWIRASHTKNYCSIISGKWNSKEKKLEALFVEANSRIYEFQTIYHD